MNEEQQKQLDRMEKKLDRIDTSLTGPKGIFVRLDRVEQKIKALLTLVTLAGSVIGGWFGLKGH